MKLMEKINATLGKLRQRGIATHLLILATLIILPFVALLGVIYEQRLEVRRHHALQTEKEAAQGLALTFHAYLDGIRNQSLAVGRAIKILSPQNHERIQDLLDLSLQDSTCGVAISWLTPGGKVAVSTAPALAGMDLSRQPFVAEMASGRDFWLGNLTPRGAVSQGASFLAATAIRDVKGRLEGAIVLELEPVRLGKALRVQRREEQGAFALFDRNGTLIYHSRVHFPDWTMRGYWRDGNPALLRVARSGVPEVAIRPAVLKAGDPHRVFAAVPIAGVGWVAEASRPVSVAFADVRRGMVQDSLLGSAVCVLAFLLAYLLGRNILRPLRRLESDARLIGDGKEVSATDPAAPAELASLRATMLAMAADLTSQIKQKRESEALLQSVFDNVYDGVLLHRPDGHVVQVNERWLKMFRMSREEAKKLTISDISENPPPAEELFALWREVLKGETMLFEWRARRPGDGFAFDTEVFICPIRFKGQAMILACVRDITEAKRVAKELQRYRDELEARVRERTEDLAKALEEVHRETEQRITAVEELRRKDQLLIQQSRLAAMGEMMGNIAHQWRQPLNVLGLVIQELKLSYQKGFFSEELLMEGVAKAMKILSHMSQTIDDFRNLLSPDKARTTFSINEVVEKVLSFVLVKARVEVIAGEVCLAEGSRNEYSQVIINILANASDILVERRIQDPLITIRIFRDNGRSVVTIADNGGGIPEEILGRIFDPYFTTKPPEKGTGLGLFMSRTIIEQSMKGTLTVTNTDGGAEFRIEV